MTTESDDKKSPPSTEFWEQAKTQARYALNWGRKVTKVGKLKMELAKMQRERVTLLEGLGRKAYQLHKQNALDGAALAEFVAKIDKLGEKIQSHERLLGQVAGASIKEEEPEKSSED